MSFRATTHRRRLARFGALLMFLAPAPALAAFGAAVTIAPNGEAPQVAVAPDGDAVIVWEDATGSVRGRTRSAAGALGPVLLLSAEGAEPQIAVDATGDALVVWGGYDGVNLRIQARSLSSDGTLGATQTVSPAGVHAIEPMLGLADDGRALIVWQTLDQMRARGRAADGTLGPIQTLAADTFGAKVVVTPDFRALVVWEDFTGSINRIRARFRAANGALVGGIQNISPDGVDAVDPDVEIADDGDALIVWSAGGFTEPFQARIQARVRSAAGALSPVQNISPVNGDGGDPQVAMQRDGDAIIAWGVDEARVQARTRSAAGTLGAVQNISSGGSFILNTSPQVAIAENGLAAFVWERDRVLAERIQVRLRNADGTLSPIQTLSAPGLLASASEPKIAMEDDGGAVAIWQRSDGNGIDRVEASAGP